MIYDIGDTVFDERKRRKNFIFQIMRAAGYRLMPNNLKKKFIHPVQEQNLRMTRMVLTEKTKTWEVEY